MNKQALFYKPLLKEAWALTKKHYWTIFLFGFIYACVFMGLSSIQEQASSILKLFFTTLILIVADIFFSFWSKRLSILVAQDSDIKFISIFDNLKNLGRFFATNIIYSLIVLGGLILLIIPGIIWAIKYSLAPYFAIEGMGVKESLQASANATKDVKLKIIAFSFLLTIIVALSMIPLFLGLFITIPLVLVAGGVMYNRLKNSSNENVVPTSNEGVHIVENDLPVSQPAEIPEHSNTTNM